MGDDGIWLCPSRGHLGHRQPLVSGRRDQVRAEPVAQRRHLRVTGVSRQSHVASLRVDPSRLSRVARSGSFRPVGCLPELGDGRIVGLARGRARRCVHDPIYIRYDRFPQGGTPSSSWTHQQWRTHCRAYGFSYRWGLSGLYAAISHGGLRLWGAGLRGKTGHHVTDGDVRAGAGTGVDGSLRRQCHARRAHHARGLDRTSRFCQARFVVGEGDVFWRLNGTPGVGEAFGADPAGNVYHCVRADRVLTSGIHDEG